MAATVVPARVSGWVGQHPLPGGYRSRTRVVGFCTYEAWSYTVVVEGDGVVDSGDRWLPQGLTPQQAAWEVFADWRDEHAVTAEAILAGEIDRLWCVARRSPGGEAGVVLGCDF